MITPFGKAIRKYRIEQDVKMKDMAEALGVKSSYLSAVESGKKRITDKFVSDVAAYIGGDDVETSLRELVEQSQPEFTVDLRDRSDQDRELVVAFARKFADLSPDVKLKIEGLLNE